jgi:hypothetical protein
MVPGNQAQPAPVYANGFGQPYPIQGGPQQVVVIQKQIPPEVNCCCCLTIDSANRALLFLHVLAVVNYVGYAQQYY